MSTATDAPASDIAAAEPLVYSHKQILRVISGILLCILLAALDQTVVIPAVPAIATELNGYSHLSWIVSAYLLTATAATPIYGKLSDIYGRRALLLPALALFIVASVLCALSQTLPQLIGFRALQGVGGAGLMSMAQAAIADVVSPRERGRYQGYMAGMWGIASVGGPLVGGFITDHLSWAFVFWINVPLGLAAMVLCNRALKLLPGARAVRPRIDYVGAALLTGGVTCWLLVMSWGGTEYPWLSGTIFGMVIAGAVLIGILVWHEQLTPEPILPPRLFRNAVYTRGVILAFFTAVGLLGTTFLLPLYFQLLRGADASSSGLLVMPYLVANVIGAFAGGQCSRYLGRTKPGVVVGFALALAGLAVLTAVQRQSPVWVVTVGMVVEGLGIGVIMPNVLVMVQNAAEIRDLGTATGAFLFLRSMGGAFGSTLVGSLLTVQFAARLHAAGVAGPIDLGALSPGGTLARLGPAAQEAGQAALSSGFRLAYAAMLVLFAVALVITLGVRDLPLRSSPGSAPAPMGH